MENHLWKFQPKRTHISWDMNANINKEKKNSGFGEALQWRSHTIIIDSFLQWLFAFAIFGFLWHHLTILLPFHLITYSTFAFYTPTLLPMSTFKFITGDDRADLCLARYEPDYATPGAALHDWTPLKCILA